MRARCWRCSPSSKAVCAIRTRASTMTSKRSSAFYAIHYSALNYPNKLTHYDISERHPSQLANFQDKTGTADAAADSGRLGEAGNSLLVDELKQHLRQRQGISRASRAPLLSISITCCYYYYYSRQSCRPSAQRNRAEGRRIRHRRSGRLRVPH